MNKLVDVLLSSDQTEGTRSQVLKWLKAAGDRVAENEPLLEIETDKVTVEIPAPCAGLLHEILKAEQEEVESGAVLARIEVSDPRAVLKAGSAISPMPAATAATRSGQDPGAARRTTGQLSPAVRRLMAEHALEATAVRGSGAGGQITVGDVLRHAADPARIATPAMPDTDLRPLAPSESTASGQLVPHSRIRKQIAAHMVESLLHTAPHVTTVFEADLSAVLAHRDQHRASFEQRGVPLTLTAYFLIACVVALKAVPEVNSRWTAEALELYERIDIGVATALEDRGLVVPVIRDVPSLDLFGIAHSLAGLVSRARAGNLAPADVRGGTFTISNHGVSGSLLAAPIIINQPQSAILGIGKLEKRAVVVEEAGQGVVAIRPRCYVTLTIDHRVLDGQRANHFLQALVRCLENWEF